MAVPGLSEGDWASSQSRCECCGGRLRDLRRVTCVVVPASCVLGLGMSRVQYEASLLYQNGGSRYEGQRTIAVGGYNIELLSARIHSAGLRIVRP
jgi:hypothetical protein